MRGKIDLLIKGKNTTNHLRSHAGAWERGTVSQVHEKEETIISKPPSATPIQISQPLPLAKLLSLTNPNLPIGGFTYSQGIEYAAEIGLIHNQQTAYTWIHTQLSTSLAATDLVLLRCMYQAWCDKNAEVLKELDELAIACRETSELRLEELQKAKALEKIISNLCPRAELAGSRSYICLYAFIGFEWSIPMQSLLIGYVWTYLESQVASVVKILPLGQTQGQKLLHALLEDIEAVIQKSYSLSLEDLGFSGLMAIQVSSLHETQYTRIYRS